jgi:hypothetical protein
MVPLARVTIRSADRVHPRRCGPAGKKISPMPTPLQPLLRLATFCACCAALVSAADGSKSETERSPWGACDAARMETLKSELSAKLSNHFEMHASGNWLLVTDLDRFTAQDVLSQVIDGAAASIRDRYFPGANPRTPIPVYVLRDMTSYMAFSFKMFDETPPTTYGYYDRRQTYILTHADFGFGPMLHEMTHVLAEADFPKIPPWLNEGISSLYEEYEIAENAEGKSGAQIVNGVVNWRLKRFRQEILDGSAVTLRALFALDKRALYGERALSNYTAARHLMLWLQEQDKVKALYTLLRDNADLSAEAAFKRLFPELSLEDLQSEVRRWAMAQHFDPSRSGPGVRKKSSRYR